MRPKRWVQRHYVAIACRGKLTETEVGALVRKRTTYKHERKGPIQSLVLPRGGDLPSKPHPSDFRGEKGVKRGLKV